MNLTFLLMIFLLIDQMVEAKFMKLLDNSKILLREKWLYCIVDDFVTKQLPHNDMESESVICSGAQGRQSFDFNSRLLIIRTLLLSKVFFLILNTQKCEFPSVCATGELAHGLRFLDAVVSQSFIASNDILELHKKFL